MEYSTADRYEISRDYLAIKEEMYSLKGEISQLKTDIHELRSKAIENRTSFYKGMLVMMYIPFLIGLIVFLIREFRQ